MQHYYTDFMLGKMPIGKAESILRQTPYKHLLDLNIQQNEWSLNKLRVVSLFKMAHNVKVLPQWRIKKHKR